MPSEFKPNPNFQPAMQRAVVEGNNAFLLTFSRAMRVQLGNRGSGRIYRVARGRRSGRTLRQRGLHQASAPNQPPAPDTGTLRRSWQVGSSENRLERYADGMRLGILFGSSIHYARHEFGYGRAAPRPYIRPTIDAIKDLHAVAIQRAINNATRAG